MDARIEREGCDDIAATVDVADVRALREGVLAAVGEPRRARARWELWVGGAPLTDGDDDALVRAVEAAGGASGLLRVELRVSRAHVAREQLKDQQLDPRCPETFECMMDEGDVGTAALYLTAGQQPHEGVMDKLLAAVAAGNVELLKGLHDAGAFSDRVLRDLRDTAFVVDVCSAALREWLLSPDGLGAAAAPDADTPEDVPPPIVSAAQHGNVATIAALLAHGAGLDTADAAGDTPLLVAAYHGHRLAVLDLIARGADVHCSNAVHEWTPLHSASRLGFADVVDALLARGADPARADGAGWTALHFAARHGHPALCLRYLSGGAAALVNAASREGETPLAVAAERGRADVVRVLLAHGADPLLPATSGATPMSLALQRGYTEVVAILQAGGPSDS